MHGQLGLQDRLVGAQEKANRKQGHRRSDNHANRNQQLANILCLGVPAQPGLQHLQNHYPGQDKHKKGKRVPGDNHVDWSAHMATQKKKTADAAASPITIRCRASCFKIKSSVYAMRSS